MLKPEDMPPLKWAAADMEGVVKFLVGEKTFNEDRVRGVVKKINTDRGKSTQGGPAAGIADETLQCL